MTLSDETTGRPYYMAALDMTGKRCLVVGGGTVARRKAAGLLAAGAHVTMVAPDDGPGVDGAVGSGIEDAATSDRNDDLPGTLTVLRHRFVPEDLEGVALVFAATDDAAVNAEVTRLAHERGLLVNVVDAPDTGDLIVPATVQRGALQIAVSTGGASPALARRLRERLEAEFGPAYGELVALLDALRAEWEPRAIAAGVAPAARHGAWYQILDLPLLELIEGGQTDTARAQAQAVLDLAFTTVS